MPFMISGSCVKQIVVGQSRRTGGEGWGIGDIAGAGVAQVADNLPLYGVCCYMDEMVHRAPSILRSSARSGPAAPLSRYLMAAPRCYCFLTHYPFFTLHFKARAVAASSTCFASTAVECAHTVPCQAPSAI